MKPNHGPIHPLSSLQTSIVVFQLKYFFSFLRSVLTMMFKLFILLFLSSRECLQGTQTHGSMMIIMELFKMVFTVSNVIILSDIHSEINASPESTEFAFLNRSVSRRSQKRPFSKRS